MGKTVLRERVVPSSIILSTGRNINDPHIFEVMGQITTATTTATTTTTTTMTKQLGEGS